jgi:hypothetical protein
MCARSSHCERFFSSSAPCPTRQRARTPCPCRRSAQVGGPRASHSRGPADLRPRRHGRPPLRASVSCREPACSRRPRATQALRSCSPRATSAAPRASVSAGSCRARATSAPSARSPCRECGPRLRWGARAADPRATRAYRARLGQRGRHAACSTGDSGRVERRKLVLHIRNRQRRRRRAHRLAFFFYDRRRCRPRDHQRRNRCADPQRGGQ